MMTRLRGLLALLGLATILVGLPSLLIAVNHIGAPRFGWTWNGLLQALTSPDDGTLLFTVLKLAGWIAWAILTLAVALELISRARNLPVPQIRGLRLPQSMARGLVAAAAALFVAAGTMTAAAPSLAQPQPVPAAAPAHVSVPSDHAARHAPVKSQRADKPSQSKQQRTWTVKRGDTLSEIALETTGRAANYPKLFRASKSTTQPDGRHLSDADLIYPGWKITIPSTASKPVTSRHEPNQRSTKTSTPKLPGPKADTPTASTHRPGETATPSATAGTSGPSATTSSQGADDTTAATAADQSPAWLLSGLAGAGALLAGGLWITLRRRRAVQFRTRRPGRTIATPDPALAPVEKTLHQQGAPTGEIVVSIDAILRRLVATLKAAADPIPALVGVDVTEHHLTARFAHSVQLGEPWTCLDSEDAQVWRVDRDADLDLVGPLESDSPPPWPQLVCLGTDGSGWRLINLEAFGIISFTGNSTYAADLARYLGTELAVSPWARDVEIDCLEVCPELVALDPGRIRHHPASTDIIPNQVAAAIHINERLEGQQSLETARVTFAGDELWASRILICGNAQADDLDVLTELIADQPRRTATAVVIVDDPHGHGGITMRLTDDGRLLAPQLGLDLVVNGLTEDEARGCAALIAAGRAEEGEPMPEPAIAAEPSWASMANAAGALRSGLTLPRSSAQPDASSVLPEPDDTYLARTANTELDLEELAPLVPAHVRARVEAIDPTLDDDLEQWRRQSSARPRVQVLGPIKVRVGSGGDPARAAARMGYYTEMVAFLCTRPEGATTAEVADAFGLSDARVRRDMSVVRSWLGIDPDSGQPFLPDAMKAPQATQRGVGLYALQDVLFDADLFRRLRLRGEARGRHGLQDLCNALELVTGPPFDAMRSRVGVWLSETHLDQHLQCAIVDVAHIVSTIALGADEPDLARYAAELASRVAPNEATPQLDLAAVLAFAGQPAAAANVARRVATWRDDSGEPPPDLSRRAEQILRTHKWLAEGAKAS